MVIEQRVARKRSSTSPVRRPRRAAVALIPSEQIEQAILLIRGQRVILDFDLAALYETSTKAFNQAAKRNRDRFPADFRFQLTQSERDEVVTNCDHLRRRKFSPVLPWAFTEHGAVMAANVLKSKRAVLVSIVVVRAFVQLRQILATHKDLARQIEDLERQFVNKSAEHETHIRQLYALLDELMRPPESKVKTRIGFHSEAGGTGR